MNDTPGRERNEGFKSHTVDGMTGFFSGSSGFKGRHIRPAFERGHRITYKYHHLTRVVGRIDQGKRNSTTQARTMTHIETLTLHQRVVGDNMTQPCVWWQKGRKNMVDRGFSKHLHKAGTMMTAWRVGSIRS